MRFRLVSLPFKNLRGILTCPWEFFVVPIPIHTGIAIPTAGSPRRFPLSLRLARAPPPPQPTLCCGSSPSQIKGGVTIVRTPSVRLARLASQCRSVGFRRISRSITAVASTHRSAQHTRHRSKNAACSSHRVIAAARQVIVYTPQTPARPRPNRTTLLNCCQTRNVGECTCGWFRTNRDTNWTRRPALVWSTSSTIDEFC